MLFTSIDEPDRDVVIRTKMIRSAMSSSHIDTCFNVEHICRRLKDVATVPGDYVECGVYIGSTLFFAALCDMRRKCIGFDTFTGFPKSSHINDGYDGFIRLRNADAITDEHFRRAKPVDRCCLKDYFDTDISDVVPATKNELSNLGNVHIVKGSFDDTLTSYSGDIALLHLDCDLYESYKIALDMLWHRVVPGGIVIFDEYFSLKYPGARIAVNEFFSNIDVDTYRFEGYIEQPPSYPMKFERWCCRKLSS